MIEILIITIMVYLFVVLPLIFKNEIWSYFFAQKSEKPKEFFRQINEDIIVKSKTNSGQTYTRVDKDTPKEKPIENEPNLAPETPKPVSATIPTEELDEAFSNNESLDIDVAMEMDEDSLDEDVEAEELITLTGGMASGVSMDEMGRMVNTLTNPSATPAEQDETVEVIEKIHNTEMMQQIINSIPDGDNRVREVLRACAEKVEKQRPQPKITTSTQLPSDFKLEDYIN